MELTAGEMLRNARTTGRRKRELNTVARLLCIKEEFLAALENDDFGKIGELVYILGFARNYAMELELDPYIIVDKIKRQMGFLEEEDAVEVEGEESTGIMDKAPKPSKFANWLRGKAKVILVGIIVAIIAGGAAIVIANVAPKAAEPEPAQIAGAGMKFNQPVLREYGLKNKDYSRVVLQAVGTTWIQIKNAAGTVVFEHSMTAGDVYYALNGATATIGNAAALDVWVDGREIPKLGSEHQRVLDLPLSPDSLSK
jgi:cytoskeletal protein RodZ